MLTWINDFQPLLYDETSRQRVARWLWFATGLLLGITLIGAVVVLLIGSDPYISIIPLYLILPVGGTVMVLLRRGRVKDACLVFIGGLWVMVTYGSIAYAGVRGAYVQGYMTLSLMAGLLLGLRSGLTFSVFGFLSVLGLATLETAGITLAPDEPVQVWIMATALIGNITMVTAVLVLSLQSIQNHVEQLAAEKTAQKKLNEELNMAQIVLEAKSTELAEANASLELRVSNRTREIELVNQLGLVLQTCQSFGETYQAIELSLRRLFPEDQVALYAFRSSKNSLEKVANSQGAPNEQTFLPDECWALRMGKPHRYEPQSSEMRCYHTIGTADTSTLCVPLTAQSEILGVFHIALTGEKSEDSRTQQTRLVLSLANRIAMAISNLRLQESLRAQAIRDPLTGLYNRRYMEEAIHRDLARSQRRGQKVAVLMLDIDHFKTFNDSFGHDAGDAILREIGQILQHNVRGEDIPCRYGGEEFVIIMPEAKLADGYARGQALGKNIRELTMVHDGQNLGGITMSVGVAIYPDHGSDAKSVLKAADKALYLAKAQGRDCVAVVE